MHRAGLIKTDKYEDMKKDQKATFYACALETTGAMHPELRLMIRKICMHAENNQMLISGRELQQKMNFRIAVAIQERNAVATLKCIQHARNPTQAAQRRAQAKRLAKVAREMQEA
jgi:hypothetical protein